MKKFVILSLFFLSLIPTKGFSQGNCLQFDGSNDYVEVADNSTIDFGTGSFTIEFWLKTSASSGTILNKKATSGGSGWRVYISSGKIYVQINGNSGQVYGTINDNIWHHVAVVCEVTLNEDNDDVHQVTVYFDGEQVGSIIHGYLSNVNNSSSLFIGKNYSTTYYSGSLEEIRIWNIARTDAQIQENMHIQISGSETGLVAYYRFNETTGTTAYDETSNNNDGTLNGFSSPWITSTVPMPFKTKSGASYWSASGSWLSGTIPTSKYAPVQIDDNIIVDNDYEVKDLTISSGKSVTINQTSSLILTGALTNSGTIKIQSSSSDIGSFIPASVNTTGTMTVERYFTENSWHYFSSPISNASSNLFTGTALYTYNEPSGSWVPISANTTLDPVRGYDVYFKNTGNKTISFTGTLNNGNQNINLTYNSSTGQGFQLAGNPYSSTIDWDATSGWSRTDVNNTIYIWNTNAIGAYVLNGGSGTNGASRYIPATQAFFVIASAGTTLAMNNSVRVITNSSFRSDNIPDELRIKINGENFNSDETLLRFNPDATKEYDGYDAKKFYSFIKSDPQIYTKDDDLTEYAINTIPYFGEKFSQPMSCYFGASGDYSIDFDFSHLSFNGSVFLEDRITNKIIDLRSESTYKFNADASDNDDRFIIHFFQPSSLSGVEEQNVQANKAFAFDKNIYLNSDSEKPSQIRIYSITGQKLFEDNISGTGLQKLNISLLSGIYLYEFLQDGNISTGKLILN